MHPMLNTAITAARAAGKIIMRNINKVDSLSIKSKRRNDYVTEVDQSAEQEILRLIHRAYPDHAFLGEESGQHGESDYQWLVDPLDGTTNFLHGFPQYAVSIAMQIKGRLEVGVVYDPFKEELFCASRGEGATLNNRKIRISERTGMSGALLGTGVPYHPDSDLEGYLDTLRALLPDTAGVRRAGSAALDLAYVANGRLDGFWEFDLKPWDIAAGVLLIKEAGGLVSDIHGGHTYMNGDSILAANPKVFKAMLQNLQPVLQHNKKVS